MSDKDGENNGGTRGDGVESKGAEKVTDDEEDAEDGKNSLDVDVDDDHRIESTLLCWPHKTWPFLGERLVNSAFYEVLVKMRYWSI